jgi:hypothetical protein
MRKHRGPVLAGVLAALVTAVGAVALVVNGHRHDDDGSAPSGTETLLTWGTLGLGVALGGIAATWIMRDALKRGHPQRRSDR